MSAVETPSSRLSDFDFEFPEGLVAAQAAEPRDSARLLVLDRGAGSVRHAIFSDLPGLLRPGDCLVLNRSKVLPARLSGRKATGGKAEILLVRELSPERWSALAVGLKIGGRLSFPGGLEAEVESLSPEGEWTLSFSGAPAREVMAAHGAAPLPPYIAKKRAAQGADLGRYQTVYAREEGSIAAPTAGLHFTTEILARLSSRGVATAEVVLHVGPGTFRPVSVEDVREHRMLPERYEVPPAAAEEIARAKARGGRIVAVGTTATRTLETFRARGEAAGGTGLFIYPGYPFQAVDALLTNFHLPRSTPLLLACAFAGRERLLSAYREAIGRGYRLFSYGDSMLIL